MKKFVLGVGFVLFGLLPSCASAADGKQSDDLALAQKFYESYLDAGYNFDPALLDKFGGNALSHIVTFGADNRSVEKTLTPEKIRQDLQQYLSEGPASNLKIRYESVSYAQDTRGVKVTAKVVYPHLCYTDEAYWALLTREANGDYRIKEEFFRVPEKSLCQPQ